MAPRERGTAVCRDDEGSRLVVTAGGAEKTISTNPKKRWRIALTIGRGETILPPDAVNVTAAPETDDDLGDDHGND